MAQLADAKQIAVARISIAAMDLVPNQRLAIILQLASIISLAQPTELTQPLKPTLPRHHHHSGRQQTPLNHLHRTEALNHLSRIQLHDPFIVGPKPIEFATTIGRPDV